jgi:hypothetical protein
MDPSLPNNLSGAGVFALVSSLMSLALCVFSLFYFRSYLMRRTGPERILAEFREEVNKLIADIDAATDRDALLLEERIKNLKSILADVDKRIGVYVRELDRRRFQEQTYTELGRRRVGEAKILELFPGASSQKQPDNGSSGQTGLLQEGGSTKGSPTATQHPVHEEIKPKPVPVAEQVAKMAKAGLSPDLIATHLGVSISEVELAIAISGRR